MKNKIRVIFQSVILALLAYVSLRPAFDRGYTADFEAYCPYGGMASFMSKLSQGTMACTMGEVQVALGIGLLVGVLLVGKLFCSFLCPIGSITEWLGNLGKKLKVRMEMPKIIDRPLRSLKYILLFLAMYFTMTSSELFCKEFDPFFASFNLFGNADTVLYFAIPAFVLTILGAIFFRLFWCRYLCPLGAISNVFMNVIGAGSVIVLFIIIKYFNPDFSYIWLIAGFALSGLVAELGFMKSFLSPMPKITRNALTCTDCKKCDKKCPQGIKISQYEKVDHIDCTLCTDCVFVCPAANTLTVKKSKNLKYLSPVVVVLLVIASLGAASQLNFTTISERWGDFASVKNMATLDRAGLKNVKCYSSAMAMKAKLETVEGIVGVDAWASAHAVKVYYDASKINEAKVKKALFTPTKQEVRLVKDPNLASLSVWEVGVFGIFDAYDFLYMNSALKKDPGVYGFETRYGEPVMVTIFYDASKTNPAKMKAAIEVDEIEYKLGEKVQKAEPGFELDNEGQVTGTVNISEYKKRIFRLYDREFNDYEEYEMEKLSAFIFPMPESSNPALRAKFGQLTSHLSADEGIVRFSTRYLDVPSGIVFFDASKTDVEKIKKALMVPQLTIFVSETDTKNVPNPFHIKPEGTVVKAAELKIDDEL